MEIKSLVYGLYPRSESLRKNLSRWERQLLTDQEINEIIEKESYEHNKKCMNAGIDLCGDPLFNWYDILRPIALSIEGISLGPLARYRETNTFYRKPIIKEIGEVGEVGGQKSLADNPPLPLYHAQERNYIPFLPGVWSFLSLSEYSSDRYALARKMIGIYGEIIKKLSLKSVVIFEPLPVDDISIYEDLESKVFLVMNGQIDDKVFSKSKRKLHSIITGDPYLVERHCEIPGITLVDSFNTKVEDGLEKLKMFKDDFAELIVTSNESMDFLPRSIADKKLEKMGEWGK